MQISGLYFQNNVFYFSLTSVRALITDYYSRVCKNDEDVESECYDMAKKGECDVENIDHHEVCAKACDFCPRFLPGTSAIKAPLREFFCNEPSKMC